MVQKSVVYATIVALTSSIAIKKAREYFDEECHTLIGDSCGSGTRILSEVNNCDKRSKLILTPRQREKIITARVDTWNVGNDEIEFKCEGSCLALLADDAVEEMYPEAVQDSIKKRVKALEKEKFECSGLSSYESLHLDRTDFITIAVAYEKESSGGLEFVSPEHVARIQFMVDQLHEFCVKESEIKSNTFAYNAAFCIGYNPTPNLPDGVFVPENPSVKCYEKSREE